VAAVAAALAPILLLTTWPFRSFVSHSHWAAVEWIPFTQKQVPLDFLLNTLLFVPLGLALAWRTNLTTIGRITLVGLLVSLMVETFQVFTHSAFSTTADVLANTLGAWGGALMWRQRAE